MANCSSCGSELTEGLKFCTTCGTAVSDTAPVQAVVQQVVQPPVQPVVQPPIQPVVQQDPMVGTKYELISAWGYIGISLLMCIPVVGLILMIIWACGGCRKLQKRNYARAMLIMFLIGFLFSLIFGFIAKKTVNKVVENIGIEATDEEKGKDNIINMLISKLISGEEAEAEHSQSGNAMESDMAEINDLLNNVETLIGGEFEADAVMGEIEQAQKEASKHADGWPASLPDYPDGEMRAVADYRTEITGTSQESMLAYIEMLKQKGFTYDDFYNFGMSEEDMLSFGGWWGTDDNLYVSLSYYEGVVTIDHLTELPDYSNLFGE